MMDGRRCSTTVQLFLLFHRKEMKSKCCFEAADVEAGLHHNFSHVKLY